MDEKREGDEPGSSERKSEGSNKKFGGKGAKPKDRGTKRSGSTLSLNMDEKREADKPGSTKHKSEDTHEKSGVNPELKDEAGSSGAANQGLTRSWSDPGLTRTSSQFGIWIGTSSRANSSLESRGKAHSVNTISSDSEIVLLTSRSPPLRWIAPTPLSPQVCVLTSRVRRSASSGSPISSISREQNANFPTNNSVVLQAGSSDENMSSPIHNRQVPPLALAETSESNYSPVSQHYDFTPKGKMAVNGSEYNAARHPRDPESGVKLVIDQNRRAPRFLLCFGRPPSVCEIVGAFIVCSCVMAAVITIAKAKKSE